MIHDIKIAAKRLSEDVDRGKEARAILDSQMFQKVWKDIDEAFCLSVQSIGPDRPTAAYCTAKSWAMWREMYRIFETALTTGDSAAPALEKLINSIQDRKSFYD